MNLILYMVPELRKDFRKRALKRFEARDTAVLSSAETLRAHMTSTDWVFRLAYDYERCFVESITLAFEDLNNVLETGVDTNDTFTSAENAYVCKVALAYNLANNPTLYAAVKAAGEKSLNDLLYKLRLQEISNNPAFNLQLNRTQLYKELCNLTDTLAFKHTR